MSRIISLLIVTVLLLGLLIALDPQARAQASAMARDLGPAFGRLKDVVVTVTPATRSGIETSPATPTPRVTSVPDNDDRGDSNNEPIIVINWDALRNALQKLWDSLSVRFHTDLKQNDK